MSDVILYPIRGQVAQVNGKNEYIVYVPRADKYTYGTVKIGEGLSIQDGVISLDKSAVPILEIQKNGIKIEPVDGVINLVLTKQEFGLDQVDNTSDENKLASKDVRDRLSNLGQTLTDDIMNVEENLDNYKIEVTELFENAETVFDQKILNLNTTISNNKSETDSELLRLSNLIKGKEQSVAYESYEAVFNEFNSASADKYNVGQSVYVQTKNVPDLWVYSVESSQVEGGYTSDEDVIRTIELLGSVRVGYYRLAMMETKSADVSNVVTLDSVQTVTGTKIFLEQIGILNEEDGDINYIKHINNNFLISTSDGDNILNIDEQLRKIYFYYEPLALESYVGDNFISYTTQQSLTAEQQEIARNNIGAGTGSGSGGTTVTVGGVAQDSWEADSKLDAQSATSTGNTELSFDDGFYVYSTGTHKFRYNGSEIATKEDIETNIISALNTEV